MYPQRFVREGSELRKGFQKKIQNVNFFPKGGGTPKFTFNYINFLINQQKIKNIFQKVYISRGGGGGRGQGQN